VKSLGQGTIAKEKTVNVPLTRDQLRIIKTALRTEACYNCGRRIIPPGDPNSVLALRRHLFKVTPR